MKHYFNEGEEYLRKDDNGLQGKSKKQYEDSAKILVWAAAIAGLVLAAGVIQHLIFIVF
jgi:hypothetical protein